MAVVNVDKNSYKKLINNQNYKAVVVDFWAPWCNPCKVFSPIFEQASNEFSDVLFIKVNIEDNPEIAEEEGVLSIPTVKIIKDRKEVFRESGVVKLATLVEKIRSEVE